MAGARNTYTYATTIIGTYSIHNSNTAKGSMAIIKYLEYTIYFNKCDLPGLRTRSTQHRHEVETKPELAWEGVQTKGVMMQRNATPTNVCHPQAPLPSARPHPIAPRTED